MPVEPMPDVCPEVPPALRRGGTGATVLAMPPSAALQPVVEMARRSLAAPMAMLFVSAVGRAAPLGAGVPAGLEARLGAFCEAAATGGEAAEPVLPFQAAAPILADGVVRGVLCVFDVATRPPPSARQQADLEALAGVAAHLLALQGCATAVAQHASAAARMTHHIQEQLCACLRLVGASLQLHARANADIASRDALFAAADCVASLEAAYQQVRNPAGFGGDIRGFLLALIGNLQEAVGDSGWLVTLRTPEPPLAVASAAMSAVGLAALALLVRALQRRRNPVALSLTCEDGLVLSIDQAGPALPPDPQDHPVLSLLAALAVPGGVTVAENATQRITVRLAD